MGVFPFAVILNLMFKGDFEMALALILPHTFVLIRICRIRELTEFYRRILYLENFTISPSAAPLNLLFCDKYIPF
jgi:hypothetical protein